MSVVYEHRNFIHEDPYPDIGDPNDADPAGDAGRFSDSDAIVTELARATSFSTAAPLLTDSTPRLELVASSDKADSPTPATPLRIKSAIPKPSRKITKNKEGKFVCEWPNCTEEGKTFPRRCEWSKHMDKHDRPYKCMAAGCDKLPGFTYSGGLLRHEREVHNKHGGPKSTHNCPYENCKRHAGKGFSRMENLNEHMRRVHTQNGAGTGTEDSEEGGSETPNLKRKRDDSGDTEKATDEVKRLRQENEELRRQIEGLNHQTVIMMQQLSNVQQALDGYRMTPAADLL